METKKSDYESALTEAIGVKHVAQSLVEMDITTKELSLQMASDYLDEIASEDPETRSLLIEGANLWAEIENMTSESNLMLLAGSSQDISKSVEGKKFIRTLPKILGDKDMTIQKSKEYFSKDDILNMVLNSTPGLSEKWYNHLYITFKMAVKVVDEETNG